MRLSSPGAGTYIPTVRPALIDRRMWPNQMARYWLLMASSTNVWSVFWNFMGKFDRKFRWNM